MHWNPRPAYPQHPWSSLPEELLYCYTLLLLILFYGCGSSNVQWFNEYSSPRIRHSNNRSGHMFIQLKCTSRRRSWTHGLCGGSGACNMPEDNNAIIQQIKSLCYVCSWSAGLQRIWGNSRRRSTTEDMCTHALDRRVSTAIETQRGVRCDCCFDCRAIG